MATGRSTKLIEEIADKIRQNIVSGAYPPGKRLKQEELAQAFAISRTPIREALSRLEAQGLVTQEQGRSAVVSGPSSRDIAEMYLIRAEMEGLAASLAARWITDRDLAQLRATHERAAAAVAARASKSGPSKSGSTKPGTTRSRRPAKDAGAWAAMNAEFHAIIASASNNRNLERILAEFRSGSTRAVITTFLAEMDETRIDLSIRRHDAILNALEKRDASKARRAMVEYMLEKGEFVVSWFENHAKI